MTKIDIISGFLGAGKTTFIKKMLEESLSGEQVVLIENEFGEVGIDGGFLKDSGIEITEMNSGCICCSLVGDFAKNLHDVLNRFHPDRILIEPSGVGKLSDVMKSVIDLEKDEDVKTNALVTVVNAKKALKQMKAFGEFFNNQIEYATTVILSRTQETTEDQLALVVDAIRKLNTKAAVITTEWDKLDGAKLLDVIEGQDNLEIKLMAEARHAQDEEEHEHEHHNHHHDHNEDGEEHEHHHHHDDEEGEEHEHHHHHHDDDEEGDEHEHHHHHHDDDEDEHEHHHHDHDEDEHEHHCHHDHDEDEHEHHHHHDHDEEGEEHECCCHHHDHEGHEHHHHHHADEVFTSWGRETPRKFDRARLEEILKGFTEDEKILRAKGMVEGTDGKWIYFDMVPGAYELRDGSPDYTGRLCVIGVKISESELDEIFGLA